MDDLLRIAQKKPNSALRAAAAPGRVLVSEVEFWPPQGDDGGSGDDEDERKVIVEEQPSSQLASSSVSTAPLCAVCRERRSLYTCPQCNVPYCSLICFRAPKHASCAEPFQRETLRGELGKEGARVDEEKRRKMMDVLRRMREMGDADAGDRQEHGSDDERDEDGSSTQERVDKQAECLGVDLNKADTQELWSLLSTEQRKEFESLLRATENAQATSTTTSTEALSRGARTLRIDDLGSKEPWWKATDGKVNRGIEDGQAFAKEALKISEALSIDRLANLRWNIVAVLAAYVYVVRNIGVEALCELERGGEQEQARAILSTMLPFLFHDKAANVDDQSNVIFEDVEEITLWTVAKLSLHAESAKTMAFLLQDVLHIIRKPRVAAIDSLDNVTVVFADLRPLLSKQSRKKLLFYAAYWSCIVSTSRSRQVEDAVEQEVDRLQKEVERAEDEERFFAANEAIERSNQVALP